MSDILFAKALEKSTVKINDIAYIQVKDVHIGNSSHVLVAHDDDENDDIAGCTKYKGNCVYWYLVMF